MIRPPLVIVPFVGGESTAHLPLQATWGNVGCMTSSEYSLWRRARAAAYDAMPHWVYKHFDAAGRLLYVGCTTDLKQRTGAHRSQSAWWPDVQRVTSREYPSGAAALAAEAEVIRSGRPLYNVALNPDAEAAHKRRGDRALALRRAKKYGACLRCSVGGAVIWHEPAECENWSAA